MLWLLWLKHFFGIKTKTEISCLFWMSFLLWNWIAELWKPKQPGEWDGTQVVTRDTILFFLAWNRNLSSATCDVWLVFFASILQGHYGTACRCDQYEKGFLPVIYPLVRQPMTPSQLVHGFIMGNPQSSISFSRMNSAEFIKHAWTYLSFCQPLGVNRIAYFLEFEPRKTFKTPIIKTHRFLNFFFPPMGMGEILWGPVYLNKGSSHCWKFFRMTTTSMMWPPRWRRFWEKPPWLFSLPKK